MYANHAELQKFYSRERFYILLGWFSEESDTGRVP